MRVFAFILTAIYTCGSLRQQLYSYLWMICTPLQRSNTNKPQRSQKSADVANIARETPRFIYDLEFMMVPTVPGLKILGTRTDTKRTVSPISFGAACERGPASSPIL